jgi:hypothetical protein
MGHALYLAQSGRVHASAKSLKGFGGAGVVELVEDDQHGTYRDIYTVKFRARSAFCMRSRRSRRKRSGRRAKKSNWCTGG